MFKRYKREFALLLDFSKGIGRYEVGNYEIQQKTILAITGNEFTGKVAVGSVRLSTKVGRNREKDKAESYEKIQIMLN